jgi:8-oxo-dGTP pyrophosphatase MutT (NUDIX family)
MKKIFQIILELLPKHAEEGMVSQVTQKDDLKVALDFLGTHNQLIIEIIERMFLSLCLLDKSNLANGEWRFVSYPASLFAKSILQTWLDEDVQWFPEKFWYSEQAETEINKQRMILHTFEENRTVHHNKSNPKPIRFVHVAWAFIKLNGQFLLIHREDSHRSDAANYVPIGGKLHIFDMPNDDPKIQLDKIQKQHNSHIDCALYNTLIREVQEETGLRNGIDYNYTEILNLNPYRQVEGAGSKHAYTEYHIKIFSIELTKSGFFNIQEKIHKTDNLIFFELDGMVQGISGRGKSAYLDALFSHFDFEKEKIRVWLNTLKNSYVENYLFIDCKDAIDFPYITDDGLTYGSTGKEKKINLNLTESEKSWLLALAWHGKNLEFEKITDEILLFSHGWLGVGSSIDLHDIQNLSQKLVNQGLPLIEWFTENKFRLSMASDIIFFNSNLFDIDFSTDDDERQIKIKCDPICLPIGKTKKQVIFIKVTENLYKNLIDISENIDKSIYENESLPKQMRRIENEVKAIGLRKILRIESGVFKLRTL